MLRRIALAITLISGTLQADDARAWDDHERDGAVRTTGFALRSDGTIESWGLLRLVLPDLGDDAVGPEWIDAPPRPGARDRLSLDTIGGRAVIDADGRALGIVRATLVDPSAGRVLALDVDLGPSLRGESRRVAIPWVELRIDGAAFRHVGTADWLHEAPATDASE